MSVGMVRMDLTRRLNAHRTLSLTVSFLALVGWGAFAYSAGSSASAERDLRASGAASRRRGVDRSRLGRSGGCWSGCRPATLIQTLPVGLCGPTSFRLLSFCNLLPASLSPAFRCLSPTGQEPA